MNNATVFGASGFIGRHLAATLREDGVQVFAPGRNEEWGDRDLGVVFYCIGLTADFRRRPFDTVTAHVGKLQSVLESSRFERLVYLSSTRVYGSAGSTRESEALTVAPEDPSDLYNLSKLMGESLVLNAGRPGIVARLSNVIGHDYESENFVPSLVRDAMKGRIELRSDPASAKDYIAVGEVVRLLRAIGERGREKIYNVASGGNATHAAIVETLCGITGCEATWAGGPKFAFPLIDTTRIRSEFGSETFDVKLELQRLVQQYRERIACPT